VKVPLLPHLLLPQVEEEVQLWPGRKSAGWRGSGASLRGLLYALSSSSASLSSQDVHSASASSTSLSRVPLPRVLLKQEQAAGGDKAAAAHANGKAGAQGAKPGEHQPAEVPGCLPLHLPRRTLRWPRIACLGDQGDHSGKLHQIQPGPGGSEAGGKAQGAAELQAATSRQLDSRDLCSSEDSGSMPDHLPSCLTSWASWPGLGRAGRR
jgi:hypothetical protein